MDVRFATEADIPACTALHNRTYGDTRTEAQWRWEFCSPLVPEIPYLVAERDGEVLGTQGIIPLRMVSAEGTFLTAKSEDTLLELQATVHCRDLFPQMMQRLFAYAERRHIHAIWGFTPRRKAFERAGFAVPLHTRQLFFPCGPEALAVLKVPARTAARRAALQLGLRAATLAASIALGRRRGAECWAAAQGITLETLAAPPLAAGSLCQRFVRQWGGATLLRDADYLRWRIFENPHLRATVRAAYQGNELLGWVAYAIDDDSMGYIVDLLAAGHPHGETARLVTVLLGDAVARLRPAGVLGVRAWQLNDHPFDRLVARMAQRLGFYAFPQGEAMVYWPGGGNTPDPAHWYITRIYTQGVSG